MTVQSTIDKLRELRLSAMAGAFEDQCRTGGLQGLSFEDRFGILVDREWESRRNNRLARLIRSAGFRYPGACMEDIEYHADRKLDRGKLLRLSGCGYIRDSRTYECQMRPDVFRRAVEENLGQVAGRTSQYGSEFRVSMDGGWFLVRLRQDGEEQVVETIAESQDMAYVIGLMEMADELVQRVLRAE